MSRPAWHSHLEERAKEMASEHYRRVYPAGDWCRTADDWRSRYVGASLDGLAVDVDCQLRVLAVVVGAWDRVYWGGERPVPTLEPYIDGGKQIGWHLRACGARAVRLLERPTHHGRTASTDHFAAGCATVPSAEAPAFLLNALGSR